MVPRLFAKACRVGLAIAGVAAAGAVFAQPAQPLFKGKTISVYIGFGGGGSYDFYGHLVARYLGRHIEGNPSVVAQSMPGAGSFKLANWLYSVAPKDGTAIGIVSQSAGLEEALGSPGIQYHVADFNWIGRATSAIEIMMTYGDARAKKIEDARIGEVLIGGTGPGSPSEGYPKLLNAGASTKFRIIPGYPASADVLLAMEKGEVDAAFTSWGSINAYHQDWLQAKSVHFLVQGAIARTEELPDVPATGELGDTSDDRAMLQLYSATADIGRSFIAPPGAPADRVAVLRAAFEATMRDPDFLAEVKTARAEFHPATGADVQALVTKNARPPEAVLERMRKLLRPEQPEARQ